MLKIVTTERPGGEAVLHLEGQIVGPWVGELERACAHRLETGTLALDLAEVAFVNRSGVELLRSLQERGVALRHCSAFVAEQLKARA